MPKNYVMGSFPCGRVDRAIDRSSNLRKPIFLGDMHVSWEVAQNFNVFPVSTFHKGIRSRMVCSDECLFDVPRADVSENLIIEIAAIVNEKGSRSCKKTEVVDGNKNVDRVLAATW